MFSVNNTYWLLDVRWVKENKKGLDLLNEWSNEDDLIRQNILDLCQKYLTTTKETNKLFLLEWIFFFKGIVDI